MEIPNDTQNEEKMLANNLEPVFETKRDNYVLSLSGAMNESFEEMKLKNPMLFDPVIRCILKFLNIKDIKNCRFVCREWGSTGKVVLANRALIRFHKYKNREIIRLPGEFNSCFLNSATLFSAFHISGDFTMENVNDFWFSQELANFFDERQKYIKELTLLVGGSDRRIVKTIDLRCWIGKSPMVQNDTKYLTKLSITGCEKFSDIPLGLIAPIKDLTLSSCRIKLEEGIRICPIKLKLSSITFLNDEIKLDRLLINDIVDFSKAKQVLLSNFNWNVTKYVVDLRGRITLDKLVLESCEMVNGEISEWVIDHLIMINIPYSLNSQMQVKELSLSYVGIVDLFTLPKAIHMLELHGVPLSNNIIRCTRRFVGWDNLQYLNISSANYSVLSHFGYCPQLTHLKLGPYRETEINSLWIPNSVKTLTLEGPLIKWVDNDRPLKLEKLVCCRFLSIDDALILFTTKILVDDVFIEILSINSFRSFVNVLKGRKNNRFGKRLYIGNLNWGDDQLDSFSKKYVDEKSSYYVFENEEKGRPLSEKDFHVLLPKHPAMKTSI